MKLWCVAPPADRVPSVPRKPLIHLVCPSRNRCRVVSAVLAIALENNSCAGGGVRRQEVWEDGTCHPLPSAELVFLPLNRVLSPSLRFLAFLLRCRHSCTETRCICLMRMSQSTNLGIRSDSVIRHLGTNLFVSKAKENLTSKWFCEV